MVVITTICYEYTTNIPCKQSFSGHNSHDLVLMYSHLLAEVDVEAAEGTFLADNWHGYQQIELG